MPVHHRMRVKPQESCSVKVVASARLPATCWSFLLADEAFGDLLAKHNRPRTLKDALKQSAKRGPANENKPKSRPSS